ncbi:MAG: tripartite tricarboxylate transporter TctB family protein [Paracoccaceae bacterium]
MSDQPDHTERRQDILAGSLLMIFAILWVGVVWSTVPVDEGVGPRAFPLWLGVALAVLSMLLLLKGLRGTYPPEEDDYATEPPVSLPFRLTLVATVCGIIAVYGFLMQTIGFMPATVLTVMATLIFALGERRPLVVIGMGLGIAVGVWAAFGQLLGAYMPPGTWITLF